VVLLTNRRSPHYMKSCFEDRCYGDDSYTTIDRRFEINGNSREDVRDAAPWVKRSAMP
jgi:hypothetical protein